MPTNNTASNKKPIISEKYAKLPFTPRFNAITDEYDVSRETWGKGFSGNVLKCRHRATNRKCALKILKDSDLARREVILHKKACEGCRYIVQILDVYRNMFQSEQCLLIVMECLEGGELFKRIKRRVDKPYTERQAAKFILMIATAVKHLHAMDIAHRDLKPENLLFASKTDDAILKLVDFGFAKEGNNELEPLKTPCYTAYYVAPEILTRGAQYDKACDIWSLGVIVYILLCGYPPFFSAHGDTLSPGMRKKIKAGDYQFDGPAWRSVSHDAKSTIQRMLTVNPADRITIDVLLQSSWLTGRVPNRPIDMGQVRDTENWEQIRAEFASANNAQRRADDALSMINIAPENSRIARRRAARQQREQRSTIADQARKAPLSKMDEVD